MKKIIYTRLDGGVDVVNPTQGVRRVSMISLKSSPSEVHEFVPVVLLENALAVVGLGRGWSAEKLALVTVVYDETEAEFIGRIQAKDVPPNATNVVVVDDADMPVYSSLLRNSWRQVRANPPTVNMPFARGIVTDHIRLERDERLAALDIDYMRADEAGNVPEKERVAVVKQELRDLPATIQPDLDAIDQPGELEAYEPTWPVEP